MARKNKINVSNALDELFPAEAGPQTDQDAVWIERDLIEPNPHQPRRRFDISALKDLGNSLKTHGQLQACLVRPHPTQSDRFQLISGERRWRATASEFSDISRLRCIIREASDTEMLQLALAENAHREDLSPIERAKALQGLKESEPGFTWDNVAAIANISKRRIRHLVELLELPEAVQKKIDNGSFNEKHGRALLTLKDHPHKQSRLLEKIEIQDLSGNQALTQVKTTPDIAINKNSEYTTLPAEDEPRNTNSQITHSAPESIRKQFSSDDELTIHSRPITSETVTHDPLIQAIRPAGMLLVEATQQIESLKLSADYRRALKSEINRIRHQVDLLEHSITKR